MKVKELIKRLETFDPEMDVLTADCGLYSNIDDIRIQRIDNSWIRSKVQEHSGIKKMVVVLSRAFK